MYMYAGLCHFVYDENKWENKWNEEIWFSFGSDINYMPAKCLKTPEKLLIGMYDIIYSYFMPVCSIVQTITPRCHGRPDSLLHSLKMFRLF